ncbi:MAG: 3,4-dihydroxy-2-butanone-4-phosphate synthase [Actinobacteria bacterium]|nr:3,4-dihydroxy-2-butanone-4-phosphate synthase [Actinomycetota bacterium]
MTAEQTVGEAAARREAPDAVRLDPVEAAIAAVRDGLPVLVVDDEDRENEGDVILAAAHATPRWIGWTVRHTSGVLCAPMPDDLADTLALPPMVAVNEDAKGTAYTVSVDARHGVTTGISAADRATTLRALADPATTAGDLTRPGHVFPLRARPGGVLERPGHTEAAVDLCRLAGLAPVGVIAEVVDDEGGTTRLPGLRRLADEFGLPLVSIADLAEYRRRHEDVAQLLTRLPAREPGRARVQRDSTTTLPTRFGTFTAHGYRDLLTGAEHVALVAPTSDGAPLVRVHSECLTGDGFGSLRCDCGPQLAASLRAVAEDGGAVVYLRGHEGRGIGLLAKLTAYALQDLGHDTVSANVEQGLPVDAREYGAAAAIVRDLGYSAVRLLTNNPEKVEGLRAHGVEVRVRVPLLVGASEHNRAYLRTKADRMGHVLEPVGDEAGGLR